MEKEKKSPEKIWVRMDEVWQWLVVAHIVYCESFENYTWLYLTDGKRHLITGWLAKTIRTIDNDNFHKIHGNCCINLDYLLKYDNSEEERWVYIQFYERLQASVRYRYWVENRLDEYNNNNIRKIEILNKAN